MSKLDELRDMLDTIDKIGGLCDKLDEFEDYQHTETESIYNLLEHINKRIRKQLTITEQGSTKGLE